MYFLLLLNPVAHTLDIFADKYLISSRNRIENIVKYSINNQAGVYCIKARTDLIPPSLWPPNSPNLNPVDYGVGILHYRVYRNCINDVEEPRQHVEEEWDSVDQRVIDSAIKEWCNKLSACVAADGGHFKNVLQTFMTVLIGALMQHACLIIN